MLLMNFLTRKVKTLLVITLESFQKMNIKIEPTQKVLSSFAGLLPIQKLMESFNFKDFISKSLPSQHYGVRRNAQKFENLVLGFGVGASCLDDMQILHNDLGFNIMCDEKKYTPKSYGNLLRSFDRYNCKLMNYQLVELAYKMRSKFLSKKESITIDIDSTVIKQYGKKMEGVRKHRNGYLCLDMITACDEFGFQYWHDVRKGNTHTANGSKEMIHEIFNRMPHTSHYKKIRKYVRADSGYCQKEFFNSCFAKDARFVVRMRADMLEPLIPRINNWVAQNPKRKDCIMFYDGRECEIGKTYYTRKKCHGILRVVVIRALKESLKNHVLAESPNNYDYFGWISSIGEHEMNNEELIRFYRKRGRIENCIREMKSGYDLRHYPCLKLSANKAYGLAAAFAYNFMRCLALISGQKKVPYAKTLRIRFIHRPAQIVRHARTVVFRYAEHHYKEVSNWLDKITQIQLGYTT